MQLYITHSLPEDLVLPLNYHHILQSIIYRSLQETPEFSTFLHDSGYEYLQRRYRMFVFGLLRGKYEISNGKIIFRDRVSFEVRSPEPAFVRLLKESLEKNGITYLNQKYGQVKVALNDNTIAQNRVKIKMVSPICIYSTDKDTGKTYFYKPDEEEFVKRINENFKRKYYAYTGVEPASGIELKTLKVTQRDKYVTKYKGFYLSGWLGKYELSGEAKYLDFLYQVGLGSKNAQGFGMFEIV